MEFIKKVLIIHSEVAIMEVYKRNIIKCTIIIFLRLFNKKEYINLNKNKNNKENSQNIL
jgi:hypothetical protein